MFGLCLRRKRGEQVFLTAPDGTEVCITLGKIHNGIAQLCIAAPADVRIMRAELLAREREEVLGLGALVLAKT